MADETALQRAAAAMLARFEQAKRAESGETFWRVKIGDDDDAFRETVRELHGTDIFPDDYRYAWIIAALDSIADGAIRNSDDIYEQCDGDAYMHDLLTWAGSHSIRSAGYASEAFGDAADLEDCLRRGQSEEMREVYGRVLEYLETEYVEDEEGDDAEA